MYNNIEIIKKVVYVNNRKLEASVIRVSNIKITEDGVRADIHFEKNSLINARLSDWYQK
jgi:hypothetical protein